MQEQNLHLLAFFQALLLYFCFYVFINLFVCFVVVVISFFLVLLLYFCFCLSDIHFFIFVILLYFFLKLFCRCIFRLHLRVYVNLSLYLCFSSLSYLAVLFLSFPCRIFRFALVHSMCIFSLTGHYSECTSVQYSKSQLNLQLNGCES